MWEIQADGKKWSGEATADMETVDTEDMEETVDTEDMEETVDMVDIAMIVMIRVAQDMEESPRHVLLRPWLRP
jgi:hypothetical protein